MKKTAAVILFLCSMFAKAYATTYYLSPTGNDLAAGSSVSAAWLSPNHALNCGDVIIAAASTSYAYQNFGPTKWGNVTCPANNNVAWLKCETFDACKISTPVGVQAVGMNIGASYWGVQGWEVSNLGGVTDGLSCFNAQPPDDSKNIHHIIFANNIANVCDLGGFTAGAGYSTHSIDYLAIVGNIVYKAGTSNNGCGSGIGVTEPVAFDHKPGTHIFVAGNLAYASASPYTNPTGCYDGNGIIFDSFDTFAPAYAEQAVIENNISIFNDGVGVRAEYNVMNGDAHSHIYLLQNTLYGNSQSWEQYGSPDCGELQIFKTVNTYAALNLAQTNMPGCYNNPLTPNAAFTAKTVDNSNLIVANWGYSATGTNTMTINAPNFSFGPNVLGMNPLFTNPVAPGPPNCAGFANVAACMAPVVANFKPRNPAAALFGFHVAGKSPTSDPFFPQWLCTANLPAGLLTLSCPKAGATPQK